MAFRSWETLSKWATINGHASFQSVCTKFIRCLKNAFSKRRDGSRRCENEWNQWKPFAILTPTNLFCVLHVLIYVRMWVCLYQLCMNVKSSHGIRTASKSIFQAKIPSKCSKIENIALNKQFEAVTDHTNKRIWSNVWVAVHKTREKTLSSFIGAAVGC